ncbi:hypothetical protein BV22DRAFT_1099887 [Leucogyrophana mollusca]|uniref:Uncharacterized protein n=1 Tax=Leucogyrophana mollusca TaxID=85980 RepID=A0ACB8B0Z0_9AGAM|nr:hypothetical protein BV22DRAFT_1099887 [Leucogyrophana mollusca]
MMNSLPTELLVIIFELVLTQDSIAPWCFDDWDLDETQWPEDHHLGEFIASPARFSYANFPYAIASVCLRWQEIASRIPEFWTNLVVILDAPTTRSSAFRSHIRWSGDLPITVLVKTLHDTIDADQELRRTRAIMEHLAPHIHRCTHITFDVHYCSSLPSIRQDFRGTMPILQGLTLWGRVSGAGASRDETSRWGFTSPNLQTLALSGANIRDICMGGAEWLGELARQGSRMSGIEFSRYGSTSNGFGNLHMHSVLDMLMSIPYHSVSQLVLTSLDLDCSGPLTNEDRGLSADKLLLKDLQAEFIIELFSALYAESATINRCPISTVDEILADELLLEDIYAGESLYRPLKEWNGIVLGVQNCPSFNDALLAEMAYGDVHRGFMCPELHTLTIRDCPNVSVRALRTLVDKRQAAARKEHVWVDYRDTSDMAIATVHPLIFIAVTGGPVLGEEDRNWFEANLGVFSWA